jgi:hypothetical protein
MRNPKRDKNENELVSAARKMGWKLWKMEKAPCDWLGLYRSNWYPVEIKMPKGELTEIQKDLMREAVWENAKFLVWRTLEDVLRSSQ